MIEWLQQLLNDSTVPLVTAFLLGLLTAISPCPLATNLAAIGYISRDVGNRHRIFRKGLLYTLGRIITYIGIGFVLIPLLRQGASVYAIEKALGHWGEAVLAPALILIGLFMLFGNRLNLPKIGISSSAGAARHGGWGALWLGALFALAFCPTSGVFYFGMLMPLAAAETGGYALPFAFALATGLPVVGAAWILAYSVDGIGRFYNQMQTIQRWMNRTIAGIFIATGIYYGISYFL